MDYTCQALWDSVPGILQAKYWSGSPCSFPGALPSPRDQTHTSVSSALAGGFLTTRATWEALLKVYQDENCLYTKSFQEPKESLFGIQVKDLWDGCRQIRDFSKTSPKEM